MLRDLPFVDPPDFEAIALARAQPAADKLCDGLRLFDRTCHLIAAGIRHERPEATDDEVMRILKERLALARRLEIR